MKAKFYLPVLFALFIYRGAFSQAATITLYDTANSHSPVENIMTVTVDKMNNKWFGTPGSGLIKYDGTNWTVYNKSNSPLPSNCIYSIVADKDNNLWIGTAEGLAFFNGTSWTVYDASSTPFAFGSVVAIAIDNAGKVWVYSLFCNYWSLVTITANTITALTPINSNIPHGQIRDMKIDADNNIWLAAYDKGLIKYDGTNWTFYNTYNSNLPDSLANAVAIDNNGDVWVGMYRGLAKFNGTNFTVYNSHEVNVITAAEDGSVWVGYDVYGYGMDKFSGAGCTHYSSGNSGLPQNFVKGIDIDANGGVWIGTTYAGIALLQENATGIEEHTDVLTSVVSPNPFSNQITFRLTSNEPVTLTIFDLTGRQIIQQAVTNATTINTAQFAGGVYLYQLRSSDGIIGTGKITRQ